MGRVTINDVAEKAQVSVGTVHRAIYGKAGVSKVVRERILEIASELNYHPNRVASTLRKKPLNIVIASLFLWKIMECVQRGTGAF